MLFVGALALGLAAPVAGLFDPATAGPVQGVGVAGLTLMLLGVFFLSAAGAHLVPARRGQHR